jgi:chromosome segregation ATPase
MDLVNHSTVEPQQTQEAYLEAELERYKAGMTIARTTVEKYKEALKTCRQRLSHTQQQLTICHRHLSNCNNENGNLRSALILNEVDLPKYEGGRKKGEKHLKNAENIALRVEKKEKSKDNN